MSTSSTKSPSQAPDITDCYDAKARRTYLENHLFAPASEATTRLAAQLTAQFPGSAVLVYGSGGSVLSHADPTTVLFDFYVITPSYGEAFRSRLLRWAGRLIPPNVFYLKADTSLGILRAKYAVLSRSHFQRLSSARTFHSYFWARFAQPFRVITAPEDMRALIVDTAERAIDTFVSRAPLSVAAHKLSSEDILNLWEAGLGVSYKAELRAEKTGRGRQLLEAYGDWPYQVTDPAKLKASRSGLPTAIAWRARAVQGAILSVLRLLKATFTFEGGIDYIAWKIKRHNGVDVPIRDWERRWPMIAAPIVALRYYRLRRRLRKNGEAQRS